MGKAICKILNPPPIKESHIRRNRTMITREQFNEAAELIDAAACYGLSDAEAFTLYEECDQDIEALVDKLEERF